MSNFLPFNLSCTVFVGVEQFTTGVGEMRKKRKSWQDKLDGFALAYLEAHRQTRHVFQFPEGGLTEVIRWFQEHQTEIMTAQDKFPRHLSQMPLKTMKLDRDFVKFAGTTQAFRGFRLRPGENKTIPFIADMMESAQKLFRMMEKRGSDRALVYFGISLIYTFLRPLVDDFRKRQFGPEALDWEKKRILAAMCLEFVAGLLRGRVEAPKGRINLELVKFINFVQEHQTEPLTDKELRDALKNAGFPVPAEEHN